jgi:hypothetical protein
MPKKESITLEQLARMVATGFKETAAKAHLERLATKAELAEFRAEVNDRFEHQAASLSYLTDHVDRIEERADRIEQLLGEDHRRRIERLETDMQKLKAKVGLR